VVHEGLVYITNAHGMMSPVYAIRETASGDVSLKDGATSNNGVAWSYARGGGYMATPLAYRGVLYVLNYNGVLNSYDLKTGVRKIEQRRVADGTAFTASPVGADGKVYFTSEDGKVYVVKAGTEYEVLATNDMGESTLATPAFSEGVMYWRTQGHLVAIPGK
jgi:outer membrane protein assembly factor BamB